VLGPPAVSGTGTAKAPLAPPAGTTGGRYVLTPPKAGSSGGATRVAVSGAAMDAGGGGQRINYFPWGEERPQPNGTTTADGREKFGTYFRDAVGLDYADQRYYAPGTGRFMTPDPSGADAADSSDPTSWNMYAYVNGDPINLTDPEGLVTCGDLPVDGGGTLSNYMNARSTTGTLTRFVWAEGGTLLQNGNSQSAMFLAQAYIAQAILNRVAVANGQVAVGGADGTIYWGNGGTFNGVSTTGVSILSYGGVGTTIAQEIVLAARGVNPPEVNSRGELTDRSGLDATLSTELGDPTRNLSGRVPVTLTNGTVYYVTPECDRAISAMQATNTIMANPTALNGNGVFVTSWKQVGNSNRDPTRLYDLGHEGGTEFYGFAGFEYVQYPYPRRRPR